MVCTFIGNRDAPNTILPELHNVLEYLIQRCGADVFYVGNYGSFDQMVRRELSSLKAIYPQICYYVALAYFPTELQVGQTQDDYKDTVFFDELLSVPKRFAIDRLNRHLISISQVVITYVAHPGNATKYRDYALNTGKRIIELCRKDKESLNIGSCYDEKDKNVSIYCYSQKYTLDKH